MQQHRRVLTLGERCEGPIFLSPNGERLDRHGAGRIVRRGALRAGITKTVGAHTLRYAFITVRAENLVRVMRPGDIR